MTPAGRGFFSCGRSPETGMPLRSEPCRRDFQVPSSAWGDPWPQGRERNRLRLQGLHLMGVADVLPPFPLLRLKKSSLTSSSQPARCRAPHRQLASAFPSPHRSAGADGGTHRVRRTSQGWAWLSGGVDLETRTSVSPCSGSSTSIFSRPGSIRHGKGIPWWTNFPPPSRRRLIRNRSPSFRGAGGPKWSAFCPL